VTNVNGQACAQRGPKRERKLDPDGPPLAGWGLGLLLLAILVAPAAAQEECAECHDETAAVVADTVHGWMECIDCHPGANDPDHPEGLQKTSCAGCHDEASADLAAGAHAGVADDEVEACASCHGNAHQLLSAEEPASPVSVGRLAETCGGCHANPEMADRYRFRLVRPVEAYSSSVHARAVGRGEAAPSCSDCHSSHRILPAADPGSPVYHARVPETCGVCHEAITVAYRQSVHGEAAAAGIRESPVCTDCHGEHAILSPEEHGSPVYATNIPRMTCGRCHGDLHLSDKYGLAHDKVPAYADSFHGLAMRTGQATVANCASCHGVHDILPSSDPRSHIHADNLAETCGNCHPGAGQRFAIGPVHVLQTEAEHVSVVWVRGIYYWLIFLVIGGMVLHNVLDLYRKGRNPPSRRAPNGGGRERMCKGFRLTHALLLVSFVVLVYTGFALKYPEAWWAAPLVGWENGFDLRGWVHRLAGVALLVAGGIHVVHLAVDRRARACIAGMRPGWEDLHELKERLGYFLGKRKEPPAAPWIGYGEKAEYLAVVWGTILMGVTGVMLWAETLVMRWLPSWTLDAATAIHFYEAVLASLAILVWHFYAVFFDPVVYPMDPAWLNGRSAPGRARERAAGERKTKRGFSDRELSPGDKSS
jgi:cytochrome b subunit of formate dehydrogenase